MRNLNQAGCFLIILICWAGSLPANTITINPDVTYQTITGWEAVAFALEPGNPAFPKFKDTLFDLAVNDLGVNRVRLEIRSGVENVNDYWSSYRTGKLDYPTWRSKRYATINDNNDPMTINPAGFHFSGVDCVVDNIVLPLKKRLEEKGQKLYVNVNYVAFTGQIKDGSYIHNDASEYAEFVLATYQHLKAKYAIVPDAWEVLLEPDNVRQWNGTLLGQAIVETAARLQANGNTARFIVPSTTNMANAITYFDQLVKVPGAARYVTELSYHRYGGVSIQNLQTIAARAKQYGIGTSMLEWWTDSNGYRTLHEDLKIGNNCAWQQGVIGGEGDAAMCLYKIDYSDPCNPKVLIGDKTKFTRQYYKFIRPGAVRIEATSDSPIFDALAFINSNGGYVVVVKADSGGTFSINGLPPANYGIKYTTSDEYDKDLLNKSIGKGHALTTAIPAAGVITIYQTPTR